MSSALPAAVRKQVAKANKLAEDYVKSVAPPEETPENEEPKVEAQTPEQPEEPKVPDGVPVEETDDGEEPKAPEPEAPKQEAKKPAPTEGTNFEQRYKVLQGKYNAEVPRLQIQLREMSSQVQQLQSQNAQMQQLIANMNSGGPQQQPAGKPNGQAKKLVSQDEIDQFGDDLYGFIQRAAQEAILPAVEERLKPFAEEVTRVKHVASSAVKESAKTLEQRVIDLLNREVPEWLSLNEDQNFLSWLDEVDPYSGALRGDLLRQAYQRHDGPRVVAFFKGFLNEHAATAAPPPAAAKEPAAPQVPLEKLVAPGTVRAGGKVDTQDGAGKRFWTRAEISQFYREKSAGTFKGRQKEAAALERDIYRAQQEGRIR